MEVSYIQHVGSDLAVVNAARVSFNKESKLEDDNERVGEKDSKLIKYLAKHNHTSPFNHSFITLRVKAPLFVARQLVKHKFMPWNEVSRRYVSDEPEFYVPRVWRKSAANVKQGSSDEEVVNLRLQGFKEQSIPDGVGKYLNYSLGLYDDMLEAGVCPEQARMVLPQSMYTEWYWSGTLGAWADMYNLRIDAHAQKETQEIAKMCGDIIAPKFPVAWEALTGERNG